MRIIAVADRHNDYAHEVAAKIRQQGFTCDVNDSSESVSKKIRSAQLMQINYMLTVGDKEIESRNVTLRTRDNVVHGEMDLEKFLSALHKENDEKALESPFASKGE